MFYMEFEFLNVYVVSTQQMLPFLLTSQDIGDRKGSYRCILREKGGSSS